MLIKKNPYTDIMGAFFNNLYFDCFSVTVFCLPSLPCPDVIRLGLGPLRPVLNVSTALFKLCQCQEKPADTKAVLRSHQSKRNRQYNG